MDIEESTNNIANDNTSYHHGHEDENYEDGRAEDNNQYENNGYSRYNQRYNSNIDNDEDEEEEDWSGSVTRCICDFQHDDGFMISCDRCSLVVFSSFSFF